MRLTLRTLLAYRDRVLKPAELEDMHSRVQQSVMASNLLKRIDSLSQRANLLAPPVEGKGLGADANSIAEYLDDTLGREKVPELERICLESDVQLAELAQCHQLLSDGLSATVEVPEELRHRLVSLSSPAALVMALKQRQNRAAEELEAPPRSSDSHADSDTALANSAQSPRSKDSQFTNNSRFRLDPAHGSTAGNGQNDKQQDSANKQPVASPMVASGGDSIRTPGLDLEGSHLAHEVPEYLRGRSGDGWLGPLAIGGLVAVLCLLVWLSIGSWGSVREMLVKKTPDAATSNDGRDATTTASERANATPSSAKPATVTAPTNTTSPQAAPVEIDQRDLAAIPGLSLPSVDPSVVAAEKDKPSTAKPATAPPKAPPNASVPAGEAAIQWLPSDSDSQQAVILVQAERQLYRLRPAENVSSGQPVFIPPEFRPRLELPSGLTWTVGGITHMTAHLPQGTSDLPQITLTIGRAVLTTNQAATAVQIITPAGKMALRLENADAQVAVDLNYPAVAFGQVIDDQAHPATLMVMVLSGKASIDMDASPISLTAGQAMTLSGTQIAQSQPTTPGWVDPANDRPVDQLAASDLALQLVDGTDVASKLIELASNRRPEMRALAAQTLSLLGSWDWVAQPKGCLNNSRDRSFWSPVLDRTRQILAAHPQNAAALQSSLASLDERSAQWRMQMWLGLTKPQLDSDAAAKLLKSLESEALIDRVLAIHELTRLTGKDLGFQPEEGSKAAAQGWARELASGKLPLLDTPR